MISVSAVMSVLRRHVADVVDHVVVGVLLVEHEVEERVSERGLVRCPRDAQKIVLHDTAGVRAPVGEILRLRVGALGGRRARPSSRSPDQAWWSHDLPSGSVWYCVIVTLMLQMSLSSSRSLSGLGDQLGILRVEVGDVAAAHRVPLHGHAEPVALVVEEPDLAAPVLGLPEDVPGDVHRADVGVDLVVAPADPVLPDDVGNGVVRAAVVERVLQLRARCSSRGSGGSVVERQQELLGHQLDDVRRAEADERRTGPAPDAELGDRLVRGVVRARARPCSRTACRTS